MKKLKRMFTLVLAFVMVGMMTVPALAADPNTYTITINNTSDQLTMEGNTYSAYKVFDVTYNADKTAYSYTVADAFSSFTYSDGTDKYDKDTLPDYVGKLKADSTELNDFADAVRVYIKDSGIAASGTKVADNPKTATIDVSSAGAGYYIVTAAAKTTDNDVEVTALCALTTTDPSTNVNLKADVPTIDKTVAENSDGTYGKVADYSIGDVVSFKLTGTIPNYASKYTEYTYMIHDTMSDGLTLNTDSIKVYSNNALTTEVSSDSYIIKTSGMSDNCDFEISFTDGYIKENSGGTVYIGYTAVLNEKAVINTGDNTNKAKIEYSNNPYETTTSDTPESDVKVYTYTFDVFKYHQADGNEIALAGAQFKLFSTEVCADSDEIKLIKDGNIYRVAKDGETAVEYVESGADGKITINGLDAAIYYLKETKAPSGYNLLDKPIKVDIVASKDNTGTVVESITIKQDNIAVDQVKVLNQSGNVLPSTGGIGTMIFYIIGGFMMLGAAILLVTKKRMSNRE